jgi:hypothetical protein
LHLQHLLDDLDGKEQAMVVAENDHVSKQIQVFRSMKQRDELAEAMTTKMVAARQTLGGLYGPEAGFELASVSGRTPRRTERLLEQLGQTVNLLRQPAVEAPSAAVNGIDVNFALVADDLDTGMTQLRGVRDQYDRHRKESEGTLEAKKAAIEEFDRTFLWVARTVEGLFHLAGQPELAARIRSTTRRPPRPSEEAAAEDPAPEEPQSDGPQPGEPVSNGEPVDVIAGGQPA